MAEREHVLSLGPGIVARVDAEGVRFEVEEDLGVVSAFVSWETLAEARADVEENGVA